MSISIRGDIHNEGTQPSIRRVTDVLDGERIRLREALGYKAPHFPLADHYDDNRDEWMYGNSSHEKLTDSGDWRETIDLRTHRYMREDMATGLVFYATLGDWRRRRYAPFQRVDRHGLGGGLKKICSKVRGPGEA